jgi:hypothetical protein
MGSSAGVNCANFDIDRNLLIDPHLFNMNRKTLVTTVQSLKVSFPFLLLVSRLSSCSKIGGKRNKRPEREQSFPLEK